MRRSSSSNHEMALDQRFAHLRKRHNLSTPLISDFQGVFVGMVGNKKLIHAAPYKCGGGGACHFATANNQDIGSFKPSDDLLGGRCGNRADRQCAPATFTF